MKCVWNEEDFREVHIKTIKNSAYKSGECAVEKIPIQYAFEYRGPKGQSPVMPKEERILIYESFRDGVVDAVQKEIDQLQGNLTGKHFRIGKISDGVQRTTDFKLLI